MAHLRLSAFPFTEDNLKQAFINKFANLQDIAGRQHPRYLFQYLSEIGAGSLIIEEPYTDADFLDDFASYYARCFSRFESTCRRIHFFQRSFALDRIQKISSGTLEQVEVEQLRQDYLGFVVARPLPQAVVGRTVVRPYESAGGRRQYPCIRRYEANLVGIPLQVDSLAFQEQDSVLAACATVALWSCFQKTALLFGTTAPTPSTITNASRSIHFGRAFPSIGLTVLEMCSAIRHVGLEPEVIDLENNPAIPLLSLVYGYLQLGVPIVLGVTVPGGLHAVAVTGYSIRDTQVHQAEVPPGTESVPMTGLRIDKFYVHDDQVGPFYKLEVVAPDASSPKLQFRREGKLIRPFAVVVPVYHKIRLTFLDVQGWLARINTAFKTAVAPSLDFHWDVGLIFSKDYKAVVREDVTAGPELKQKILMTAHPRFIWRCALKFGSHDLMHVIFDATGIARSFPIHSISWWNPSMVQFVATIFSSAIFEGDLRRMLTDKLFELIKSSVISSKPLTSQPI
jgi:hypothetical protein